MNRFREMFYRMQQSFGRWMYGRNGLDAFSVFCYVTGLVLMFIDTGIRLVWLSLISYLLFFYAVFRMFSKNREKRSKENRIFLGATGKVRKYFHLLKLKIENGKSYRYFICSDCGQTIRVPKGKGKIEITCPRCKNRFIKKT